MLTNYSKMPFGKHKGTPMIEIPPNYLLYLYSGDFPIHEGDVRTYIESNLELLKSQVKAKSLKYTHKYDDNKREA